jgi:hypothetical protein
MLSVVKNFKEQLETVIQKERAEKPFLKF